MAKSHDILVVGPGGKKMVLDGEELCRAMECGLIANEAYDRLWEVQPWEEVSDHSITVTDAQFSQIVTGIEDATGVEDDDPPCVCGVYRSEHGMMGCPEGFQTADSWEHEKQFIASLDEDEFERIYGEY